MSEIELKRAIESLFPDNVTVYSEEVPDEPSYPYVYLTIDFPYISERAYSRRASMSVVDIRATCVAGSEDVVWLLASRVAKALEMVKLVADGWSTGRITSVHNGQGIQRDLDVEIVELGVHPQYLVTEWQFAASRRN